MKPQPSSTESSALRGWWGAVVGGRQTNIAARAGRLALRGLSGLYWLGLKANLLLYSRGLKRRSQSTLPVVSVGNLTLGGTGKTTAVRFIAHRLQQMGIRPAIVLRGYQTRHNNEPLIIPANRQSCLPDVTKVGDEAYLLAQQLPHIPIGVGKRREAVIAALSANSQAQLVLLDDGFQYFRMDKLIDIVLIDATVDLSSQRLFPAGYLREPLSHLRRAEQVWLTHSDLTDAAALSQLKATISRIGGDLPVVETKHEITDLYTIGGEEMALHYLEGKRLLAVSAIGNPASFERSLRRLGAQVVPLRYDDHHYYVAADLEHINCCAREHSVDLVAITAKDAVKWPANRSNVPVAVVDCQLRITKGEPAFAALLEQIKQAVGEANNGA